VYKWDTSVDPKGKWVVATDYTNNKTNAGAFSLYLTATGYQGQLFSSSGQLERAGAIVAGPSNSSQYAAP
jgi:hypothetical protein